jgi:Ca-activated chloride channel homolog
MVFEISGIRLQNADYLYLLAVIPLTVLLWRTALRRKRQLRRELFGGNLQQLKARRSFHLSLMGMETFKYLGFTLILLALVFALAQPQIQRERVEEERAGIDAVILLDLSFSMLAEDIVPSRLKKAKEVIRDFIIRKRQEDRIALVSFAETSLILSYLTRDPENLLFYLDYLEPHYGTNIGRAIKSGLRVFEREDEMRSQENQTTEDLSTNRIIVLLSDGEDHGEELEEAVEASATADIKIYCIGIGSRRSVPIPTGLKESGMRSYLQNEDGSQVFTQFSESTLRDIAKRTSARFYRSFIGYEMARAFESIILKEREIKNFRIVTHYQDIYYLFLVGSLGLFLFLLTLDRQ